MGLESLAQELKNDMADKRGNGGDFKIGNCKYTFDRPGKTSLLPPT
jgi:hypothetical protein